MIFKHALQIINIRKTNYCTKSTPINKLYSSTVILPKTNFPLRLENNKLIERDKCIYELGEFESLYDWQRSHLSEPEFVLHDGPPYANGQLHMGHAINKILKDTILRYEILKGYKVHYVPGWDCHGLPIELKAISNSDNLTEIQLREKARNFATVTINKQKEVFQSWGVLGDWKNAYRTYTVDYVKMQLRQFLKLYRKKLIYRDYKPVFWSPSSRTALAEAELEYNEAHKSPSLYFQIEIKNIPKLESIAVKRIYGLLWTTTPWTLPANCAVCYNEALDYSLVKKIDSEEDIVYLVASELLSSISATLRCNFEVIENIKGYALQGSSYVHPIYKNRVLSFFHAAHVTATKGTGLVHTAPAHGSDDFLVSLNNRIPVVDIVDTTGCYKSEAGTELFGKNVFSDGTQTVIEMLGNNVLHLGQLTHSYPYDWRTKQPVITKASQQWFLNTNVLKNDAIEKLADINILPKDRSEIYKNNLINTIQKRPYWCISRQRKWGVPIPVFYNKSNSEIILNDNTLNHHCNLLETHGTDFWWKLSNRELLPESICDVEENQLEKSQDIMDIWLDSGLSWAKVLEGSKVADMYLEGSDQFTGWFQSSLLTSVAIRNKAPFKSLYVHGFAVDEKGNKMSKSLGNVIDPVAIIKGNKGQKPYGIDVLRWWVTCHANQTALAHVTRNVLQSSVEEVQKIRSILRFALGGLSEYRKSERDWENTLIIDRYVLHLLYDFHLKVNDYLTDYHFNKVGKLLINFLTNPISTLYYTSIKDRLYCENSESDCRKAAQYVLLCILETVTQTIAPMMPHLAEEIYQCLPQKDSPTFFTRSHQKPNVDWQNPRLEKVMGDLLSCRSDVNKLLKSDTLGTDLTVNCDRRFFNALKSLGPIPDVQDQLADIFQVSSVTVIEDDAVEKYTLNAVKNKKSSCPRCRKIQSRNENELCKRCYEVISVLPKQETFISN